MRPEWPTLDVCARRRRIGGGGGFEKNSVSLPAELGELVAEEAALDASERMDSSLILVFRGSSI